MNMQKNKVSKTIGDRKKASKGKDKCEELVAESKGLDDAIAKADEIADKATAELQ
jgi:seryl-tRNA synthetase